jgi:uncharacterized protein (UPF0261 family)
MSDKPCVAVVGTFDSKGEEHLFIKKAIERRGFGVLTINIGTKTSSSFTPDFDLFEDFLEKRKPQSFSRDEAIEATLLRAKELVARLYQEGRLGGIVSAGGGTGTHMGTCIMRELPLGVPKVMVSTVASRDMSKTVGTKDITMMHTVVDLLGVNSISGRLLDKASAAVCGMIQSRWQPPKEKKRIALTLFGFITEAAENVKASLEAMKYEVIAFHANGTGGMAMEELADEGYFHGILDLATHELSDELMHGYCRGIGPGRLEPSAKGNIPRLVIPGGLDCAVLEFDRQHIPDEYKGRKIFFYDFRSAIRLNSRETRFLAHQLAKKLNLDSTNNRVLIPLGGWSEDDREGGSLFDPEMTRLFIDEFKGVADPRLKVTEANYHINDAHFAGLSASIMNEMVENN